MLRLTHEAPRPRTPRFFDASTQLSRSELALVAKTRAARRARRGPGAGLAPLPARDETEEAAGEEQDETDRGAHRAQRSLAVVALAPEARLASHEPTPTRRWTTPTLLSSGA